MYNSKYFKKEELDCNCPNHEYYFSEELLKLLDTIREHFKKPIFINSGCRCPAYNKAVGGEEGSAHTCSPTEMCEAVDIRCEDSQDRFSLINLCLNYGIRRIGINPKNNFIHIDIDKEKPQDVIWLYQ